MAHMMQKTHGDVMLILCSSTHEPHVFSFESFKIWLKVVHINMDYFF